MQWTDTAIVLSCRKHSETSAIVKLLSHQHGIYAGAVRGASSKKNRGVLQPGNLLTVTWQARLEEHLGSFVCELDQAYSALLMPKRNSLAALTSACALLETALPERHPYSRLYEHVVQFLQSLTEHDAWLEDYVYFEYNLLADTGFGLDLRHCAATGSTEDLCYVSPKSGRAVSREAGAPYKDKLLPLPEFLYKANHKKPPEHAEILAGLEITGYFLRHWLLESHHKSLPAARQRLIDIVEKEHG